jgi:hypothetical protein
VISLPPTYAALVRTDFSDDAAWTRVVEECLRPSPEGFEARLQPIDDRALDGADWRSLRDAAMHQEDGGSVLFVVDATTLATADHPVLVVSTSRFYRDDLPEVFETMTPYRCIPSQLWAVENNLNLANMDWHDYAGRVDSAGVFRGF